MKPKIIRSRLAVEDLAELWHFIAKDSIFHAERFIRFVDERLQHLARHPLIGRPRDELSPDLRSFPVRHLLVCYRPIENGIEIARILHSSRDIGPEHFQEAGPPG